MLFKALRRVCGNDFVNFHEIPEPPSPRNTRPDQPESSMMEVDASSDQKRRADYDDYCTNFEKTPILFGRNGFPSFPERKHTDRRIPEATRRSTSLAGHRPSVIGKPDSFVQTITCVQKPTEGAAAWPAIDPL